MPTKRFSGNSNYELDVTTSVSSGTISLVVRVRKITGFGYFTNDGQPYTVVIDGTTYSGSWTYDFTSSSLESVTTRTKTGMTSGTKSWSVTVNMTSGIGSASLSGSLTVPPEVPVAPTIGTPVRNSDTSQTAHWSRNATTDGPYGSQQIQRRTFDGDWSAWVGIATVPGVYSTSGSQSRSDATAANRAYQYRVKASNSAGEATSDSSVTVYTTPGAPSSVVAAKTAAGGIKLTLVHTVPHSSYETEIQYSTNGGSSWSALTTLAAGATTYTWGSPPGGSSVVFRARVVNDTPYVGDNLASSWRTSNTVPLSAPPAAPSALDPNGVGFDGGDARTFTWQHNSTDTSDQESYEIQHRPVAGSWTSTGKLTGTVSEHVFPAATFTNGVSYEWQVRTWGVNATASPWSATATFTASTPPTVSIVAPGSTLEASILAVEWTYFDDESTAQSAWEASLTLDGDELEARNGSGDATGTTFTTRLTDATEYQVAVRVRDGSALWSDWDTVTFTTDFPAPPEPVVSLAWDPEQGAVIIDIENPTGGDVDAVRNDIYWSVDGETWTLAVEGAAIDTPTADPTAPVGVTVQYKVVAWSDLPSSVESDTVIILTPDTAGYWSAAGSTVAMEYGNGGPPRVDYTGGLDDKTLHFFAGRTLPVEITGQARLRTGDVSFMITTPEQLRAIRELQFTPAPHLIRVPDGTLVYASIGPVRATRMPGDMYDVSLTITEVTA